MSYYFEPFPLISYDLKKNNNSTVLTNIATRFKMTNVFQNLNAVYYNYSVKEGERADHIAFKYYDDASLDWVIYLINNIIDPEFEWPLDKKSFNNFITKKYGSITTATSQIHHYEQITQSHNVLYDGTIIPEEVVEVDLQTYNTLNADARKIIYSYDYEVNENDKKRDIKLLAREYLRLVLNNIEFAFR